MRSPAPQQPWTAAFNPAALTELEVAAGLLVGTSGAWVPPLQLTDPICELEALACALLSRPPCVISFSGGRDSSALLAVFTRAARTYGLDEPVAVTARWPGDENSEETEWQEQVVRHIGVREWTIIHPDDAFDLLGPVATAVLGRRGLTWPPPAYALTPLMRLAAGGTFVSGEGGDEVFGSWRHAWMRALRTRSRPPRPWDAVALAQVASPQPLRVAVERTVGGPPAPWLKRAAVRVHANDEARTLGVQPRTWAAYLAWTATRRRLTITVDTLRELAEWEGARYESPLLDPGFLGALAQESPRWGLGGRTAVMGRLFGHVLPDAVLRRSTKATFGNVFWQRESRAFARAWDGSGVDAALVDRDALRAAWLADRPVYTSALALHAAWLACMRPTPLRDSSQL